ncbi:MAG TPA: hypothetical protein VJ983_01055 [candidate division Zixibacteria bacterium]|nr:hypothetical protein [candidate division Zixibacteria bacterium]
MLISTLRLATVMISCVLLAGKILAANGYVYPDSARILFSWQASGDTITVQLTNAGTSPVQFSSITDITNADVTTLRCTVDGADITPIPVLSLWGSIYPSKLSTSWQTGAFSQSALIRFVAPEYQPGNLSWMAFSDYPMFGMVDSAFTPGDCCVGMRGNINNDPLDQTDISDLIYFVEYMFDDPPAAAPPCFEEADINEDGALDIGDLIALVDYTFGKGPDLPSCP